MDDVEDLLADGFDDADLLDTDLMGGSFNPLMGNSRMGSIGGSDFFNESFAQGGILGFDQGLNMYVSGQELDKEPPLQPQPPQPPQPPQQQPQQRAPPQRQPQQKPQQSPPQQSQRPVPPGPKPGPPPQGPPPQQGPPQGPPQGPNQGPPQGPNQPNQPNQPPSRAQSPQFRPHLPAKPPIDDSSAISPTSAAPRDDHDPMFAARVNLILRMNFELLRQIAAAPPSSPVLAKCLKQLQANLSYVHMFSEQSEGAAPPPKVYPPLTPLREVPTLTNAFRQLGSLCP